MTRPKRGTAKARVNFELPTGDKRSLGELRDMLELDTYSETLRRAVNLLRTVSEHVEAGGTVILEHPERERQRLVIL